MHPMLNIAINAARKAGNVMLNGLKKRDKIKITLKGRNDFVSEIDQQAEAVVIDTIKRAYPQHAVLGEETGYQSGEQTEYEWIIDPIDGTTNYLHANPQFCVSIALRYQQRLEHAVIYDPTRDELYTASRGQGAFLNDRRIRVTSLSGLENALLGTGFPFREQHHLPAYLEMFRAFSSQVADLRRPGSAALDLAYVAAGRLDGFWEIGLKPWDMAAGVLLVQEAGGIASDFSGGHDFLNSGNVVAASPKVLKAMLQTIQPYLTEALKK